MKQNTPWDADLQPLELNPYTEHVRHINGVFEDMLPLLMRAMNNLNTLKPFVDARAKGNDLARFNELASDIIRVSGGLYDAWETEMALVKLMLSADEEPYEP